MGAKVRSYVFCKQTGDPPGDTFDFSDWTCSVCKELMGRPVNCHAFRSATVTSYYQTGANQSQMNALADVAGSARATEASQRAAEKPVPLAGHAHTTKHNRCLRATLFTQ
jgi:hypothetical protein